MNKELLESLKMQAGFIGNQGNTVIGTCHEKALENLVELIVKQCGYHADIFEGLGCPVDMDPTETKPSDYIKRSLGVE